MELLRMGKILGRVLLISVLVVADGCGRYGLWNPPRARSADEVARDNEVLEAAMLDLVRNAEFSPVVASAMEKRQIILDDSTFGGASPRLVEAKSLTLSSDVQSQLRDDAVRRNPWGQRFSIAAFRPADRNVVVQTLHDRDLDIEFCDRFPDACGYVQSLLPGFSEDGQTALFGFHFGPSRHDAFGVYILKSDNKRWKVTERSLRYFD